MLEYEEIGRGDELDLVGHLKEAAFHAGGSEAVLRALRRTVVFTLHFRKTTPDAYQLLLE